MFAARRAMVSTLAWSQPRSASSERVASNTAARVRAQQYNSAKLHAVIKTWLTAVKIAAEQR